eukprot:7176793-Heterocapsa_arctica.AAC.1
MVADIAGDRDGAEDMDFDDIFGLPGWDDADEEERVESAAGLQDEGSSSSSSSSSPPPIGVAKWIMSG